VDVKSNYASNYRVQQAYVDQKRRLKDGESIDNNDRRLGVIFAFDTISGQCNDFVCLISSDFADDIYWLFSANISSKAKIYFNGSDAISIQLLSPYNKACQTTVSAVRLPFQSMAMARSQF
jgi:hypothetical protein